MKEKLSNQAWIIKIFFILLGALSFYLIYLQQNKVDSFYCPMPYPAVCSPPVPETGSVYNYILLGAVVGYLVGFLVSEIYLITKRKLNEKRE